MRRLVVIISSLVILVNSAFADTLRVISLYPGHSDNIYALGGENFLIALSENDDEDLLPNLPRISLRAGAEKLLALNPDIVVTRSFAERLNPGLYEILKIAGVRVISLDPPTWEKFPEYLKTLATSLNLSPDLAITKLNEIRSNIRTKAHENILHKAPRIFLEATSREVHTCAPDSWAANLITLAGGINIAKDAVPLRAGSSIASWGVERVLKSVDNLDVYIIQTGAMNNSGLDSFYARQWSSALINVKVYTIPEKFLSRPSLLGLERGGNELMKIFWGM